MRPNEAAQKQSRGPKKRFYCQTCMIDLNSEDTMTSHLNGVKHMKKQLAMEARQTQNGQPFTNKHAIVPVANPEAKKKVPIRLQDKIKESSIPMVGLDYIKEFIAVSDSEMEPHYECSICDKQGQANGIFSHLMGQRHRYEFVARLYAGDPSTAMLSQTELLDMARKHDENKPGFADKIRTRFSDEEYPWPAGKEPWSVLRGGLGIAPDGARNNYAKNQARPGSPFSTKNELERKPLPRDASPFPASTEKEMESKPLAGGSEEERSAGPRPFLPPADSVKPPQNLMDSEKMLELGQHLILQAADFSGLKHTDRGVLQSCFAALKMKFRGRKRARSRSPTRLSMFPPTRKNRTRSPSSSGSTRSGASSHREEKSFDQMSPPSSLKREIGTWEEEATRSTGTRSPSSTASSRSETSMGGGSYRESSRSRPRSPQDQRRYGVESRSRNGSLQEERRYKGNPKLGYTGGSSDRNRGSRQERRYEGNLKLGHTRPQDKNRSARGSSREREDSLTERRYGEGS